MEGAIHQWKILHFPASLVHPDKANPQISQTENDVLDVCLIEKDNANVLFFGKIVLQETIHCSDFYFQIVILLMVIFFGDAIFLVVWIFFIIFAD